MLLLAILNIQRKILLLYHKIYSISLIFYFIKKSFCIYKKLVNVVYKCTDTMAALISNAFTLWFILFGRKMGTLSTIEIVTVEYTVAAIVGKNGRAG